MKKRAKSEKAAPKAVPKAAPAAAPKAAPTTGALAAIAKRIAVWRDKGYSEEEGRAMEERSERNTPIIMERADIAFKRWQVKLREAGVVEKLPPAPANSEFNWTLVISPPRSAQGSMLHSGASMGLAALYSDVAWEIERYLHTMSHARPVRFYARTPEELWPGDPNDGHRDIAYLRAAGVAFVVRPGALAKTEEWSSYVSNCSTAISITVDELNKELDDTEMYPKKGEYPSIAKLAISEKELDGALIELTNETMEARRARMTNQLADLEKRIAEFRECIDAIPCVGAIGERIA